jgi:hypothetical protein
MRSRYPTVFGNLDDTQLVVVLLQVQKFLRKTWGVSDVRHRDWYLTQMRDSFHQLPYLYELPGAESYRPFYDLPIDDEDRSEIAHAVQHERRMNNNKLFSEPPPVTPFEAAAFYFQKALADRARCCAGGLACPAPYFVAKKRWQKYCSEACAGPANREAKRRWWHEHKGKGSI